MQPHPLSTGLVVALMELSGPDRVPPGTALVVGKANAEESGHARHSTSVPPARAPSVAVAEEYEPARQKGTVEAFDIFIARHNDEIRWPKRRASS